VKYWQQCNKIVRYSTLELFPGLMTVSFRHLHSVVCLAVRSAQVSLLVFTLDLAVERNVRVDQMCADMTAFHALLSYCQEDHITKRDMRDSPSTRSSLNRPSTPLTIHYRMPVRLLCRLKASPTALATRPSCRCLASKYSTAVKPTKHETSRGRLASRSLQKAISCLHEDGLVMIKDAIAHGHPPGSTQRKGPGRPNPAVP
jgi:hypothetical protein